MKKVVSKSAFGALLEGGGGQKRGCRTTMIPIACKGQGAWSKDSLHKNEEKKGREHITNRKNVEKE